jgi:long-subunit acyl-CoA synthetase (AMP-forming)
MIMEPTLSEFRDADKDPATAYELGRHDGAYTFRQAAPAARRIATGLQSLRARSTGNRATVLVEDLHELVGLAEWLAEKLEET